jgi:carbonic anhydrase/acetyltransferase-like protein (isoleucine patch superfamily)
MVGWLTRAPPTTGGRSDQKEPDVPVYALGDRTPTIDPSAFVHPDAVIIGDVTLGPESTVWPTAVLRGDHGSIRVGARTSIQDGTVVHCTAELPTIIGDDCVVGHNAHLEGAVVEDGCLIGSGSVVLHRVVVRAGALVGAGALVPNGTEVPPRAMALGVPCRIKEDAVAEGAFDYAVERYVHNGHWYRAELRRLD